MLNYQKQDIKLKFRYNHKLACTKGLFVSKIPKEDE
jgi:hypothetical protein